MTSVSNDIKKAKKGEIGLVYWVPSSGDIKNAYDVSIPNGPVYPSKWVWQEWK